MGPLVLFHQLAGEMVEPQGQLAGSCGPLRQFHEFEQERVGYRRAGNPVFARLLDRGAQKAARLVDLDPVRGGNRLVSGLV